MKDSPLFKGNFCLGLEFNRNFEAHSSQGAAEASHKLSNVVLHRNLFISSSQLESIVTVPDYDK